MKTNGSQKFSRAAFGGESGPFFFGPLETKRASREINIEHVPAAALFPEQEFFGTPWG